MQSQDFQDQRRDTRGILGATDRDVAFQGLPIEHESLIKETLYLDDDYKGTTYWASLPAGERTKWVNHRHSAEASRELKDVWEMSKADPLDPIYRYFRNYAVTGVGFLAEGYVLFSVGNVLPLPEVV